MIASTTKLVPPAKSRIQISTMWTHSYNGRRTCELVKFERKGDGKEEELVGYGDQ